MTPPAPRSLFRATALAEAVTWTLLLAAMALKYTGVTEALMPVAGGVHGFVFLCYVAVSFAIWIDARWPAGRGIAAVASAVVPYATIPVERGLDRRGLLPGHWRLHAEPGTARGPLERLLRVVLARPVVSVLAVLALVAVVFVLLLQAGPPTEWF